MNYLIKKNYESIVARGLISPSTSISDFVMKLEEEVQEFIDAIDKGEITGIKEELSDVILVCLNFAHHYGWDIESELFKKVAKNELRASKILKE